MRALPSSWAIAPLGAFTVDCGQRVPDDAEEFKYIDIGSINRDTKRIETPQQLLGENAPSRARKHVRVGDVLVSMTRPNLNAVALVPDELDGQIASTGFDVLRAALGIEPRWVAYLVRTEAFVNAMSELVQGALYPAVRPRDIRGFEAPLAPLAEQKRIADKLDALLARVDACRDRLDRIPTILKRFRQSVLAAATSGKLTDDWRVQNPLIHEAKLLYELLKQDHENVGGHARGNASEPTEDAHTLSIDDLPNSWDVAELRDICIPGRPITYGILKPGPELEKGVPYIRVADFPGNKLKMSGIKRTSPEIDEQFRRARLIPGDLLLSIRGSVGRLIKIPTELDGANITQDTARLSISNRLCVDYIYFALLSEAVQKRMKNATRGVAVRGINIGDVRALQIPLPPIDEQTEIVRRVEALFAYADRLEARYTAARAQVEKLTPATLAKAFRGELVPQDPNDEPANELLERIKAQRSGRAEHKPTRSRRVTA